MEEKRRINYRTRPKTFEQLGDGSYYYNYDIQEVLIPDTMQEEAHVEWTCLQVMLWGPISYTECVKAIIHLFIGTDDELKLVNNYNCYVLGIGDDSAKEQYLEYLDLRAEIKANVRKDFEEEKIVTD